MTRSRYKFLDNEKPYFLTCTVVRWIMLFNRPDIAQIILDSLQFMQQHNRLLLYGYVVMENHLHIIASASDMSKEIGDFKSYTARMIINHLEKEGPKELLYQFKKYKLNHMDDRQFQVWQEGSHPEAIKSEEMFRQKLNYLHQNPLRRGYVDEPADWRYSSARNYQGEKGLIEVVTEWF